MYSNLKKLGLCVRSEQICRIYKEVYNNRYLESCKDAACFPAHGCVMRDKVTEDARGGCDLSLIFTIRYYEWAGSDGIHSDPQLEINGFHDMVRCGGSREEMVLGIYKMLIKRMMKGRSTQGWMDKLRMWKRGLLS